MPDENSPNDLWELLWEGGYRGGLKNWVLSIPFLPILGLAFWACLHFDIPSPYAPILLFVALVVVGLGEMWLESVLDRWKRSRQGRP